MPKGERPPGKMGRNEKVGGETMRPEQKVPEGAENMEHTLRRLVREKERQRSKHPERYH